MPAGTARYRTVAVARPTYPHHPRARARAARTAIHGPRSEGPISALRAATPGGEAPRNPTSGTDITYDGNKGTYNKIQVDLNTLVVLARSHPNNDPTINQVNTVIESVHGLEDVHRQRGRLSPDYVDQKQKDLMMMFSSIIRTENTKKAAR